jgi:hypothetical protein
LDWVFVIFVFLVFIRYDDMIGFFDDGLPWRPLDLGDLVDLGFPCIIGLVFGYRFSGLSWLFGFFA